MSEWRVVALGSYTGRAVLTVPGADTVILAAATRTRALLAAVTRTRALHEALSTRADLPWLELPDAERMLDRWFRDHPEDGRRLASTPPAAPGSPSARCPAPRWISGCSA
ncbi:hypothetical protein FSY75_24740 [Streptomyces sp. TR1341]|uniref:hypothetical protein n=1 Tax=Streptomyces sp. TR1341 TaxID=2601266 RepID=UPI00138AFE72|nr:hypothetical protein [Streptomyces sp. TR1341]